MLPYYLICYLMFILPLMLPYCMNTRQIRGKSIVEKNDQIRRLNESHYEIKSQSRKITHDVIGTEFGWSCSCEGSVNFSRDRYEDLLNRYFLKKLLWCI